MRLTASILLFLFLAGVAASQHEHSSPGTKLPVLLSGLGNHHHPITTTNAEAQQFFDQGLALVFNFNHGEAVRSFERAAEIDPQAPMPQWGIAFALGSNINDPITPERMKSAVAATEKAKALAANGTELERAYIDALARRYSTDSPADGERLAIDFKDAMAELVKRYPDDLDAEAFYADALMNLHPWKWWSLDGQPNVGTLEAIAALESVLKRDQNHIYANHLYIHAMEQSPHPERALPSAARLGSLVSLSGHLVHMPFHIFFRTGDYFAATKSNEAAVNADREFLRTTGTHDTFYGMMYYNHNLHSLAISASMAGRFTDAINAASELFENLTRVVKEDSTMGPFMDSFTSTQFVVYLRFQRWQDILAQKPPGSHLPVTTAVWRFARGVALAATGKVKDAVKEQRKLEVAVMAVPEGHLFGWYNTAADVLRLAGTSLEARIKAAEGNRTAAVELWRKAVGLQDYLYYDEPPAWYYPTRESLGAELLRAGQPVEAEKIFRADLERTPRNARSLLGLRESLKAQGKNSDAQLVQKQLEDAWKNAEVQLRVEDL